MSKQFTLKNPGKLGEHDPKYGQRWWANTHDSDVPVSFNLMEGEVHDGETITAEEWVNKQSSKGTEYMQLRKVKTQGRPTSVTASTGTTSFSGSPKKEWQPRDDDRIVAQWAIGQAVSVIKNYDPENIEAMAKTFFSMVDRVKSGSQGAATSHTETKVEKSQPAATPDVVVDFDESEEIDLSQIPF